MVKKCKIPGLMVLSGTMFLLPIQGVFAASNIGIGVDTEIVEIHIPPGSTYSDRVYVFNESENIPLPVHIDMLTWGLRESDDSVEFVSIDPDLDASRWFDLEKRDLLLDPREYTKVPYVFHPPKTAPEGGYLVMMKVRPVPPEHYFEEGGPRFIPEIAILFFINVGALSLDGDRDMYGANISSLEAGDTRHMTLLEGVIPGAKAGVFDSALNKMIAGIENTGTFFFKAEGTLEIKNALGATVETFDLPDRYLIPGKTRKLEVFMNEDQTTLDRIRRVFYAGPFSAYMTLTTPEGDIATYSTDFFVFPWKSWGLTLLLVAASIYITRKLKDRLPKALRVLVGK